MGLHPCREEAKILKQWLKVVPWHAISRVALLFSVPYCTQDLSKGTSQNKLFLAYVYLNMPSYTTPAVQQPFVSQPLIPKPPRIPIANKNNPSRSYRHPTLPYLPYCPTLPLVDRARHCYCVKKTPTVTISLGTSKHASKSGGTIFFFSHEELQQ